MEPDTRLTVFEIEIDVEPSDIDQIGHVNNVIYLRWVQEAATAHWSLAASDQDKESLLWVVTKHEIEYKRSAVLGDTVIAKTWVGEAKKRAFERHTELVRKSDNKLLAKAVTLWCPIDAKTKRPTRVGAEIYKRFSVKSAEKDN